MNTKVIPLSRFEEDPRKILCECLDTGEVIVVEMPDKRLVAIQSLDPADEDDPLISDLIETNAAFREMVARSNASPLVPFSAADQD